MQVATIYKTAVIWSRVSVSRTVCTVLLRNTVKTDIPPIETQTVSKQLQYMNNKRN